MSRMFSLKTCLFFLIVVVVGLTIVLISRCQTTALAGNKNWKSRHVGSDNKNEDGSVAALPSYYQSVNYEEDANNKITKNVQNDWVKSPKKSVKVEQPGDYPFEDDFVSNDFHASVNEESKNKANKEGEGEYNEQPNKLQNGNKKKTKEHENSVSKINSNKFTRSDNPVADIKCDINHGKLILGCKKQDNEVFIPFSFLHKYFEVFGKMADNDDSKFIWLHSQVKIYRPKAYKPTGAFTYFENYNVEVRDRVKCVSGAEGVPVSTQWDANGYFYPIQIAQFGLSHYSKYLAEGEPERTILENGDDTKAEWNVQKESEVAVMPDPEDSNNNIIKIQNLSPESASVSCKLPQSKPRMLVMSWDMKTENAMFSALQPNVTITAVLRYENQLYYLHYVTDNFFIKVQDNHIYHGLGLKSLSSWQHVIRDLGVDVQKGISLAALSSPRKSAARNVKISKSKLIFESLSIDCKDRQLLLDNLTLSTNEHLAQFFQASDWFVSSQDENGGWPIPVRRKFAPDFYPVLESGWYSAMGQGHALSLLSRAYSITKNRQDYANACAKAVENIFDLPGSRKGVRAVFMEKFVWYEEYPTTPSTFVLNGFMYALLGLYDVTKIGVSGAAEKAGGLYEEGLKSLKTMLPLYDTGSGTMYDLRHFTVPGISPNLARLDYHVTHINQLLTFATIDEDSIFAVTAERWINYTEGNRAPHN